MVEADDRGCQTLLMIAVGTASCRAHVLVARVRPASFADRWTMFVFIWAAVVEPYLPWPRLLSGLAWDLFLLLTLAGSLIMPLSGLGFMGWKTRSWRLTLTGLLLHTLWGVVIGMVYVPLR